MATHAVAKVVEIVGSSGRGWAEAADNAVRTASQSIKHITGIQVATMTAKVSEGRIKTYRTTIKVAFGVEE